MQITAVRQWPWDCPAMGNVGSAIPRRQHFRAHPSILWLRDSFWFLFHATWASMGQRYLIKIPHLGRHSQSLRLGASLILRASHDVPFTRFIFYHHVKFLKKFTFLPHSPCCLAQEQWFPEDGLCIISIHATWNISRNKNTEIVHPGTSRLCFNKAPRIPMQSKDYHPLLHFIIDHTVPQMRISKKLQVFYVSFS